MQTLLVSQKDAWGQKIYEPKNETAQKFCALLGQQNLTAANIKKILDLGYIVEMYQDNPFKK